MKLRRLKQKKQLYLHQSKTVENESPIINGEDKNLKREDKKTIDEALQAPDKRNLHHPTALQERGLFSVKSDQQQIKITTDSKTIAAFVQKTDADAMQNKRPARAKKSIPGQALNTTKIESSVEKSEAENSSAANDSTFKLRS